MQTNTQMIDRCIDAQTDRQRCTDDAWAHRWIPGWTHGCTGRHTVTQMDVWMDTQAHRWTHRRIFNSFSFFGLGVFLGGLMNPVTNTAPHVRRALNAGCVQVGTHPGCRAFPITQSGLCGFTKAGSIRVKRPPPAPTPLSLNPIAIMN